MDWATAFEGLLKDFGIGAEEARREVAEYAAERSLHLSTIVDEAGFPEALVAERDNVALKAGIVAAELGDEADRTVLGAIAGALGLVARAIAPGV